MYGKDMIPLYGRLYCLKSEEKQHLCESELFSNKVWKGLCKKVEFTSLQFCDQFFCLRKICNCGRPTIWRPAKIWKQTKFKWCSPHKTSSTQKCVASSLCLLHPFSVDPLFVKLSSSDPFKGSHQELTTHRLGIILSPPLYVQLVAPSAHELSPTAARCDLSWNWNWPSFRPRAWSYWQCFSVCPGGCLGRRFMVHSFCVCVVQMQSGLENIFEGFEVICPSQPTLEWDALHVEFGKKHFRKWAVIYG